MRHLLPSPLMIPRDHCTPGFGSFDFARVYLISANVISSRHLLLSTGIFLDDHRRVFDTRDEHPPFSDTRCEDVPHPGRQRIVGARLQPLPLPCASRFRRSWPAERAPERAHRAISARSSAGALFPPLLHPARALCASLSTPCDPHPALTVLTGLRALTRPTSRFGGPAAQWVARGGGVVASPARVVCAERGVPLFSVWRASDRVRVHPCAWCVHVAA